MFIKSPEDAGSSISEQAEIHSQTSENTENQAEKIHLADTVRDASLSEAIKESELVATSPEGQREVIIPESNSALNQAHEELTEQEKQDNLISMINEGVDLNQADVEMENILNSSQA